MSAKINYMDVNSFNQLHKSWEQFGKNVPYWSVLTHDVYKPENINDESKEEFYNTGKITIDLFENILQKNNHTFKNKIVLDFGCGVGRMTKSLHGLASSVYGIDISEPHLEIARNADKETKFFLLNSVQSLPSLPQRPNVIFSFIALQHTRPSLIKHHIKQLLDILNEGGVAAIHLPYDIQGYHYVDDQVGVMEMHFLSKEEVYQICESNNCHILDVVETRYCGDTIKDCVYVIKKISRRSGER